MIFKYQLNLPDEINVDGSEIDPHRSGIKVGKVTMVQGRQVVPI